MEWEILDDELVEMYRDKRFGGLYSQAIVKAFRKVMQVINNAVDERDLYAMKSLHFREAARAGATEVYAPEPTMAADR